MVWPIWSVADMDIPCGVADMVFGCGRYHLAVADIVVAGMVCGQYGRTLTQYLLTYLYTTVFY